MTYSEMVRLIPRLSIVERLQLLELLSHSVRVELEQPANTTIAERMEIFERLAGALKTDEPPPSDEELKEDYVNYLTEKYS
jgi:hypothetical protein